MLVYESYINFNLSRHLFRNSLHENFKLFLYVKMVLYSFSVKLKEHRGTNATSSNIKGNKNQINFSCCILFAYINTTSVIAKKVKFR